jgi:hypothetical protein
VVVPRSFDSGIARSVTCATHHVSRSEGKPWTALTFSMVVAERWLKPVLAKPSRSESREGRKVAKACRGARIYSSNSADNPSAPSASSRYDSWNRNNGRYVSFPKVNLDWKLILPLHYRTSEPSTSRPTMNRCWTSRGAVSCWTLLE